MHKRSHLPLWKSLRNEVTTHGSVFSLWRGFAATLWRDVPFSGLYWMGYEVVKKRLHEHRLRQQYGDRLLASPSPPKLGFLDTFLIAFGAGVTSGGFAAFVTTPFDVVKTRRQVDMAPAAGSGLSSAQRPPTGTAQTLAWIARHQGIGGLFAGVTARTAKVAPSCAIMIASYELGKLFFQRLSADLGAAIEDEQRSLPE